MNSEELRRHIEAVPNVQLRSIRVFKKSFHVNYWTKSFKVLRMYKVPIASVAWKDIEKEFTTEW